MYTTLVALWCVFLLTNKKYIAKFESRPILIAASYELSCRKDCIKMCALIHNQFQAPIYGKIRCLWYAAKLITCLEVFYSVSQVAFLAEVKTTKCKCIKHLLHVHGVTNVCVFIAFMISSIQIPASLSPCYNIFSTVWLFKALVLENVLMYFQPYM